MDSAGSNPQQRVLLRFAEEGESGPIIHSVRFLAAAYNGQAFSFDLVRLYELRAVDVAISDSATTCCIALTS